MVRFDKQRDQGLCDSNDYCVINGPFSHLPTFCANSILSVAAFFASVSVKVVVQLPELAASCWVQNFLSGSTVTVTGVLAVRPVSVQVFAEGIKKPAS